MKEIILDCDLMRFRNSGLYHYCLNLGNYVQRLLNEQRELKMRYYVPPAEANAFEKRANTIVEKKYHKFFRPFLHQCRVWHAPFQSGRVFPDKRRHRHLKVLLTIHDLNALHEGKPLEEQRKSLAHTQDLITKSDAIVCISEFVKQDVLKNCEVGNRPIYVIHNGIHKVHEPYLNGNSYRPQRPFLFGMGYVNRKKNFHVLLPLIKERDVELVISGRLDEADYVESIKSTAERMGIADRVFITGPVTEGEKSWYLNNCTAFVHPSLAEGFGAPVVEAMQFGKPLFLSDKTSLPEIGGEVAFYFSSFEEMHMRRIFEEGMHRYEKEQMGESVIRRSKVFDWRINAEKYLDVYKSLL
jgi:glycosyltransferase involved in cell wall biosynthesis